MSAHSIANHFLAAFCGIMLGVACFAGLQIYNIEMAYKVARDTYDQISTLNSYQEEVVIPSSPVYTATEISPVQTDFNELRTTVNKDIIAWLYCPDTKINYPVVHYIDDDYYLKHDLYGHESQSGVLFLQTANYPDFSDRNNIIHGHHMMNGTMLATIEYWVMQKYYDEHPVMYLNTAESGNYRVDIVAAFETPYGSTVYNYFFPSDASFDQWISWVLSHSGLKTNVEASMDARYITLSTCAYSYEGARSVLVGKLVPIG